MVFFGLLFFVPLKIMFNNKSNTGYIVKIETVQGTHTMVLIPWKEKFFVDWSDLLKLLLVWSLYEYIDIACDSGSGGNRNSIGS